MIKAKAYAKINIFLDILGKLENGYHSLFMVMQSVGIYDELEVEKTAGGIELACSNAAVPTGSGNTAYKAAELFFRETGIKGGADIKITKNIPMQAGLAGGSADAAAVLSALNSLYATGLSTPEICRMGLKIGSDVPFCAVGGTCLAQNTGGILSPLVSPGEVTIVLAKPEKGVSTKEAYEQADSVYLYHPDHIKMLDCCERGDLAGICKYAGNVFEQVVEVPERVEIKRIMRENGAMLAQMSGSGPTVFGIFDNPDGAEKAAGEIKIICRDVFVTAPADRGVELI